MSVRHGSDAVRHVLLRNAFRFYCDNPLCRFVTLEASFVTGLYSQTDNIDKITLNDYVREHDGDHVNMYWFTTMGSK